MAEESPTLFSLPPPDRPSKADGEGEYTLERVMRRRPEAVRIAAGLLSDGASILHVARVCEMGARTVMLIKDRLTTEAGKNLVETDRQSLAAVLRRGALLCAETIEDKLQTQAGRDAAHIRDLAQVLAIVVPQAEILEAKAPQAPHTIPGPSPADIIAERRRMESVESVVMSPRAQGDAAKTGQGAEEKTPPPPAAQHEDGNGSQTSPTQEVAQ